MHSNVTAVLAVCASMLAACVPNAPYRTQVEKTCDLRDATASALPTNAPECDASAVEVTEQYTLGFVEFDDQGAFFNRRQMDMLFRQLDAEAAEYDLTIIVYVHGWKHNASQNDPDVSNFRIVLLRFAKAEQERHGLHPTWPARKVVGIYVGWPGLTLDVPEPARSLTFWTRKAAALHVAQGSVRELFARARELRDFSNRTPWPDGAQRSTRLIFIGHSFGGLIVYSALAQYLVDAGARPAARAGGEAIPSYGDLVVLVNPAFEAVRYDAIRQIMRTRAIYAPRQNPVFIAVTSRGDWATKYFFPLGRRVNTTFERWYDSRDAETDPLFIREEDEARETMGHISQLETHRLSAEPSGPASQDLQQPVQRAAQQSQQLLSAPLPVDRESKDFCDFNERYRDPAGHLRTGWRRTYTAGALLEHEPQYSADNPFWIVSASTDIIRDHNDIYEPIFLDFLRQVFDDIIRQEEGPFYGECSGTSR